MSGGVTRGLVGLLLRLYPERFRDRYGAELEESFTRLVEVRRGSGRWAALFAWIGGIGDLALGALRERARERRDPDGVARPPSKGGSWASGSLRDLRHALRHLRRQPLYTVVAAGSLAIGIGANTAVFSLGNALLLRPMPGIGNYERVVELGRTSRGEGFDTFAYPDFVDIRNEIPALDGAAAYNFGVVSVSRGAEGIRALGYHVTPSYFRVLGVEPAMGRHFLAEEDVGVDQHPVVVLSHRFWTERLGAEPDILGSTLRINRIAYTVVGVTASDFQGHMIGLVPDLYMPMTQVPVMSGGRNDFEARNASWHLALGLLAADATVEELDRQLRDLGTRLADAYPESNRNRGFRALALGPLPGSGRGGIRLFVVALMGMVGLILLVTCTNVAGMSLARAVSREREVAVRLSLGAGRGSLLRLLMAETLVLFALGGALGVALGVWAVSLLRPELLPTPVPVRFVVDPDTTVFMFSLGVTLSTGVLFGLWPAARATRVDVARSMKEERLGGPRGSGRLRLAFAGTQVGLSLVLLASAGLFLRSLQNVAAVETGFDPERGYVTFVDLSLEGYSEEDGLRFQRELLSSLRSIGWVEAASLSSDLPLDLSSSGTSVRPQGWDQAADARLLPVDFNVVSDGYFEALGIPLRTGRTFSATDDVGEPLVVVVSERFAQEAWPGEDPIGRTLRFGSSALDAPPREVVGVVADTKNQAITEAPKAFVYLPLAQRYRSDVQVVVKSASPRDEVVRGFREAIMRADPNMALGAIAPLDQYTALGTLPQRIAAWLTTSLGALALLLSGLGIYGVISYAVGRQRREIGIRMALGADRSSVAARFLLAGVRIALPGLAVGVLLALLVGRAIQSLLLELNPYDPVALASVSAVLLLVVTLAAWIPARRAAGVQPAESLRRE